MAWLVSENENISDTAFTAHSTVNKSDKSCKIEEFIKRQKPKEKVS